MPKYDTIVDKIYRSAKRGNKPGTIKDKDLHIDDCGTTKRRHRTKRLPPRQHSLTSENVMTPEQIKDRGVDVMHDKDLKGK